MSSAIAEYLRTHKQSIWDDWERAVVPDLKELAQLERAVLIDHLPEVLDALAAWVEGTSNEAERLFSALADGHALQRLGFGIELSVLNVEYGRLRHVILTHLLAVPSSPETRQQLIRLDDGLDRAIQHAVLRYSQRRDQLRDRFIGILGHDLRGPLTAASFAVHALAASTALSPAERRAVQTIARAADRMTRMVGDVLDFARSHLGGGIPATPIACDMGEICQTAVDECRVAHPERAFTVKTDGDLSGTFDRDRVLQCIGNLIANAVQHGEDPIAIVAFEADDRRAVLTRVSNRGKAIAPEVRYRLFDPFVSAKGGTHGGLGLGLYITSEIARSHGGTCDVASDENETSFTIRWPRTPRSELPGRP